MACAVKERRGTSRKPLVAAGKEPLIGSRVPGVVRPKVRRVVSPSPVQPKPRELSPLAVPQSSGTVASSPLTFSKRAMTEADKDHIIQGFRDFLVGGKDQAKITALMEKCRAILRLSSTRQAASYYKHLLESRAILAVLTSVDSMKQLAEQPDGARQLCSMAAVLQQDLESIAGFLRKVAGIDNGSLVSGLPVSLDSLIGNPDQLSKLSAIKRRLEQHERAGIDDESIKVVSDLAMVFSFIGDDSLLNILIAPLRQSRLELREVFDRQWADYLLTLNDFSVDQLKSLRSVGSHVGHGIGNFATGIETAVMTLPGLVMDDGTIHSDMLREILNISTSKSSEFLAKLEELVALMAKPDLSCKDLELWELGYLRS